MSSWPVTQQTSIAVDAQIAMIGSIAASVNQVAISTTSPTDYQILALHIDKLTSSSGSGNEILTAVMMNAFVNEGNQLLEEENADLKRLLGISKSTASYPFGALTVRKTTSATNLTKCNRFFPYLRYLFIESQDLSYLRKVKLCSGGNVETLPLSNYALSPYNGALCVF